MRRLLVNDALNQLGEHTFWNDLQEWFGCEFVGGAYSLLPVLADRAAGMLDYNPETGIAHGLLIPASLVIRNASWFGPMSASHNVPTISLLQDIFTDGPLREMQQAVIDGCTTVVYNSPFTASQYERKVPVQLPPYKRTSIVIPLPVDFDTFEPGNPMGLQQALSLPDRCICWVGASEGAAGHVKGWDIFLQVVRLNPDLHFVAVFKDAIPDSLPPNLRAYARLSQPDLARVIGACRVGLCTSRTESQHLAGIEMGACGLPLVAPPVGVYWERKNFPGGTVVGDDPRAYTAAIRNMLTGQWDVQQARAYWFTEFSKDIVRAQWESLVKEVECRSGE